MPSSTITLQNTLNFASTHADLLPLANVGGFTNEPGLTICNDAISDLVTDPNDWTWNRVEMAPLFTCPNKQDQLFAGAMAFTLNGTAGPSMGWAIDLAFNNAITVAGGVVTVKTLEAHRLAIGQTVYMNGVIMNTGITANYNSTFTDDGSKSQWNTGWPITAVGPKSFSFAATAGQANSDVGGAPGITNFGYATSATFQELSNNSSPPNKQPCTVYRELPVVSRVANPDSVSVIADLGTGVLKIRFHMVPGSAVWETDIVYQAQPPLYTALSQVWGIPDSNRSIINQAVLYRMYRYLNSPTAQAEYEKLQQEIAKQHGNDNASPTDVHIQPEESLMDSSYWG
jgi:hypothetical protein